MKKIFISALAVLALVLTVNVASAGDESVAGGFEASGSIVSGFGWQKYKNGTVLTADYNGNTAGVLGAYLFPGTAVGTVPAALGASDHDFQFFVDSIELDLAKTFGENIRFRTDLDFGATNLGGGSRFGAVANNGAVVIEQAYATANFAVGNGIEFLLGRFNAPVGFEAVDVANLDTISHSKFFNAGIRPVNLTGAKFYYPFSDSFDFNFYLVNDLTDDSIKDLNTVDNNKPSFGLRFGYSWGDEGAENTVGLSAAGGWENTPAAGSEKLSYLGDLDFNVHVGDAFAVGGEVLYRLNGKLATGGANDKYYAGLLNLNYDFSDVWDGTLRYAYSNDVTGGAGSASAGSLGGGNGKFHEMALAGGYAVADGAKFKLEANYTMVQTDTAAIANPSIMGLAGVFSYNF